MKEIKDLKDEFCFRRLESYDFRRNLFTAKLYDSYHKDLDQITINLFKFAYYMIEKTINTSIE